MFELYKKDGFCQLITVVKPGNLKTDEFKKWWLEKHVEITKKVPNLRWYTVCFNIDKINNSDGSTRRDLTFDGYEELYFDSLVSMEEAFKSDHMMESINGIRDFVNGNRKLYNGLWAETNMIKMKGLKSPPKSKGCFRVFGGCKKSPDMSRKKLKEWYHEAAKRIIDDEGKIMIPEIIGYNHNFPLEKSPFGEPFVDAYCNNWWSTLSDMRKTFEGEIWRGQLEHREEHIDIIDKSLFLGAVAKEYVIDL